MSLLYYLLHYVSEIITWSAKALQKAFKILTWKSSKLLKTSCAAFSQQLSVETASVRIPAECLSWQRYIVPLHTRMSVFSKLPGDYWLLVSDKWPCTSACS